MIPVSTTLVLATLSEWHLILALLILFLLFGGRKLPELARGLGEAIKEFKKSQRETPAQDPSRPQEPSAGPSSGAAGTAANAPKADDVNRKP